MMEWKVIDAGIGTAQQHMDRDYELLQEIDSINQPILHFYEWDGPSITYGYFIDPYKYLDLDGMEEMNFKWARRPTGGGIVLHLTDLAFSILIPTSHPSY